MSFLLSWKSSQVCQSCAGSTLFKFTCLLTESICFNKISVSWARGSLFPLLFSIKEVLRQKQSFKLLASFIQSYLSSSTVISLFFPISAHAAILWTTYLHSAGWKLFTLLISAVSCIFTYWNASEWLKTSRYYNSCIQTAAYQSHICRNVWLRVAAGRQQFIRLSKLSPHLTMGKMNLAISSCCT